MATNCPDITRLPVSRILPKLISRLQEKGLVLLEAPPGAGKSTLVPPALLDAGLNRGKKILLLEPRRLAARSLAHTISRWRGERAGETCGYRVHRETRVSKKTKIEVITEGILVRMLQSDPTLEEVGLILFDEFHERNLLSDLALSLLLEVRRELREDLRLLFMSATPDCQALEGLFPGIPMVRSEGRAFPVDTFYRPSDPRLVAEKVLKEALEESDGDVLVFLPGEREIRRWEGALTRALAGKAEVLPLYGRLSLERQNQAVSPHDDGRRRVVLATSIAETSLTIPGVTAVVDSGLVRKPLYNKSSGITLLQTREISLASAEQRRGRAGRVCPGKCYRLWEATAEQGREKQNEPEILQADLAPLVLELARWGQVDPSEREWLTPPPAGAWHAARNLLQLLGLLDREGRITPLGKRASELPLHPRLAVLLLSGAEAGLPREAALLAAFLQQRDFLPMERGSDILLRLEYLAGSRPPGEYSRVVHKIREEAVHLQQMLKGGTENTRVSTPNLLAEAGALIARAYPDRVGLSIERGLYQLSGGGRVMLHDGDSLSAQSMIVAAHCGGNLQRQRLFLGATLDRKEVERILGLVLIEEKQGHWDRNKQRVSLKSLLRLGQLTLKETPMPSPGPEDTAHILSEALQKDGLECLPWDKESRRLYARMVFCARQGSGEWPSLDAKALAGRVDDWLVPFFNGGRFQGSLVTALKSLLPWNLRKELDLRAPDFYQTALGNRRKIDYSADRPFLPVPLQEMYGTGDSPQLGREPLVLHLLNPAGRPVQLTADLKSFWSNAWPEVRSELKGRYPKHYWPENPAEAVPSLKTGKKRPE